MAGTFYNIGGHEPEAPGGFLTRDLFRFLAVDIIIILILKTLLFVDVFPSPDSYVLAILASKLVLFSYLVWLVRERRDAWPETGAATLGRWWAWLLALPLYAAALPLSMWAGKLGHSLVNWLYALVGWRYIPEPQDVVLLIFADLLADPVRIALVAFTVLGGPFMEELAFRGMGMDGFRRSGGTAAALFWTSLLFGVYHFSLAQLLPLGLLGLLFGVVRVVSGSLWCALAVHCLHNSVVLALHAHEFGWFELPKLF